MFWKFWLLSVFSSKKGQNNSPQSFWDAIRDSVVNALKNRALIPTYSFIEDEIINDIKLFYQLDICELFETLNFRENKWKTLEEQEKIFQENLYHILQKYFLSYVLTYLWIKWKKLVPLAYCERQINSHSDNPNSYSFPNDISKILKDVYSLVYNSKIQSFSKFSIHSILQNLNAFHSDIGLITKFIQENALLIIKEHWKEETFYESILSKEDFYELSLIGKWIEKSPFDGSLVCFRYLKVFEKAHWMNNIFSDEEKILLIKIYYLQYLTTEILIRLNFDQSKQYSQQILSLFTLLHTYIKDLKKLLWSQEKLITLRKLYQLIFTPEELAKIPNSSFEWFESWTLKKKLLSITNYTAEQKRNFCLIILAVGEHTSDKYNKDVESYIDSFVSYLIQFVITNNLKTQSVVSFLWKINPYPHSFSFLSYVICNNLEEREFLKFTTRDERNILISFNPQIFKEIFSYKDFKDLLLLTESERETYTLSGENISTFNDGKKLFTRLKTEHLLISELHPSFWAIKKFTETYKWKKITEEFIKSLYTQNRDLEMLILIWSCFAKIQKDRDYIYQAYHTFWFSDVSHIFYAHFFLIPDDYRLKVFEILKKILIHSILFNKFITLIPFFVHHKDFSDLYDIVSETENKEEISEFVGNFLANIEQENSTTTHSKEKVYADFSQISWLNPVQIRFLQNRFHWNDKNSQKVVNIFWLLTSHTSKDKLIDFLRENSVEEVFFYNVHAILTFFKDFWIKNFEKIEKLFSFCFKIDSIEERIKFLYERIHNYVLSLWEEKEFKDIIMKFIKNGDYSVLDEYFFTSSELDSLEIQQKIVGSVTPLWVSEVIRKLWRLWYTEKKSHGWWHRVFTINGENKITVPFSSRNSLNKFTLKEIISSTNISLEDWNNL